MPCWLYALLTWTTRARAELIDAGVAAFLRDFLPRSARLQGATVLEIGVVTNHVHLVLALPPRLDVPQLVQHLKGASARTANRDHVPSGGKLRWAAGYDLRSVCPRHTDRARAYVRNQAERHPELMIEADAPRTPE